jgi:pimeloyl-ACP methyl ester carboxylesterase
MSKPNKPSFPIAIICGGSSSKDDINSIIHVHRYILKEFLDLGVAVLTVEQRGVDGSKVNVNEFMDHYTRSERLKDHQTLINHLKSHPAKGWNGKFIFMGVSEGGPIVTSLTTQYSDRTIATINWVGADGWSWRDELWVFIKDMEKNLPWHLKLQMLLPKWMNFSIDSNLSQSRQEFDNIMDETITNPTADKEFMGMTYKYHADALSYPPPDYNKIRTPFLVVAGVKDTIIQSSDEFVQKAKNAGAPITYMRIEDMDHIVRKRPDVVKKSFEWLNQQLLREQTTDSQGE